MPKEEKKSSGEQTSGGGQGDPSMDIRQSFESAFHNYLKALNDAQSEIQKNSMGLQKKYAGVLNEAQVDARKGYEDAVRESMAKFQDVQMREDAQSRYQEISRDYAAAMQNLQSELQKRCEEAYTNYTESIRPFSEDVQKLYRDAYLNYLKEMQKAWSNVDITHIDANMMALIGQIMTTTSIFAGSTVPG